VQIKEVKDKLMLHFQVDRLETSLSELKLLKDKDKKPATMNIISFTMQRWTHLNTLGPLRLCKNKTSDNKNKDKTKSAEIDPIRNRVKEYLDVAGHLGYLPGCEQ